MRFLIYLIYFGYLSQFVMAKSDNNIVLSGGGGCKGNGALVMQNGKKGKKSEKLIIKDDALIMQDEEADGNLIMDGSNLIFKEGKKHENIIIKGNGGGHSCQQDKEEHVSFPIPIHLNAETRMHSTYVPAPMHHKKINHHRNDQLGLGSREDLTNHNNTAIAQKVESSKSNEHQKAEKKKKEITRRKILKRDKSKVRKLKLGDKLSLKDKEHLKLRRVDRRFGLVSFRLAGMMKKMRWRKSSEKFNSKDKSSKEIENEEPQSKNNKEQETQDTNDQQYEEEDGDDKDQEDETSNLFHDLTNAMYPAELNSHMTPNFNNMMNLYPPPPPSSSVFAPSSNIDLNDRYDSRKKYEKENYRKMKKSEYVKDVKEDQIKSMLSEFEKSPIESETSGEEVDNGKKKISSKDELSNLVETSTKSNDYMDNLLTSKDNLKLLEKSLTKTIVQPIFAPDDIQISNQLPPLLSLLALTSNIPQLIQPDQFSRSAAKPLLPLYTPDKQTNLDNSALLLPLIAHKQQQLIKAQQQKLLVQEAKQKELTKKLQQATAERDEQENYLNRNENKIKNYQNHQNSETKSSDYKDRSKLIYSNEPDYLDEVVERRPKSSSSQSDKIYNEELDDKFYNKYDNEYDNQLDKSINRLRRRKGEYYFGDENDKNLIRKKNSRLDQQFTTKQGKASENYDKFDFFHVDSRLEEAANELRSNSQTDQTFSKRMLKDEKLDKEQNQLSTKLTNNINETDYKASTINEVKLGRNASLIVYGY